MGSPLFVDAAAIIVIGKNFLETHRKLWDIMTHLQGIFTWAKDHNCEFSIRKFQLLDISKRTVLHALNPRKQIPLPLWALVLGDVHILSKETARFLGVIVNKKMSWKGQCAVALTKGQDWIIQFSRLA